MSSASSPMAESPSTEPPDRIQFRGWLKQALPAEHGSWAFVLEPLLIAGIAGGPRFTLAGLGAFLCFLGFRPASLAARDRVGRKIYPRTAPNTVAGGALIVVGIGCLAGSGLWLGSSLVLLVGALAAFLQGRTRPRALVRELAGAAFALPLALFSAPAAAAVLILRPALAVLSVRGVIGRMDDARLCLRIAGVLAFGMACAWFAFGPSARSAFYVLCAVRTWSLVLRPNAPRATLHVGLAEVGMSLLAVIAWAIDLA